MAKVTDITGQKFGRLTAIKRQGSKPGSGAAWLCKCDCGNNAIVAGTTLRKGKVRSCGCLHRDVASNLADITNQIFGRLTVIERRGINRHGAIVWLCHCECGKTTLVTGPTLRSGATVSCGCFGRERAAQRIPKISTTHGKSKMPEYHIWAAMIQRCKNPNNKSYENYGGRGIVVCDRWKKFENFIADMGPRRSPDLSLERVNNDGNYEPSNCKWATRLEQGNNTRRTIKARAGRS